VPPPLQLHPQAIINASKVSGAIVRVDARTFRALVQRSDTEWIANPVVIASTCGIFSTRYRYLMNFKGFFFFTESPNSLSFPREAEVVNAKKIWIPD